jgi:hypothetical protein
MDDILHPIYHPMLLLVNPFATFYLRPLRSIEDKQGEEWRAK